MQLQTLKQNEAGESFGQAVELFNMRCRSLNLTSRTIEWYEGIFYAFLNFIETYESITPSTITANHIRAFLDYRRQKGTAPGYVRKFYDALKTFFKFLSREGIIPKNPMESVEKPKGEMRLIKPLNSDQIQLLLAQPNTKKFTGLRNWGILVLLLDTGLRLSEFINLKVSQIDWQSSCLTVFGKGRKERKVPYGARTKKALWDYYKRRGEITGQDFFFVDQFGRQLKRRWVAHLFKGYGKKAGIEGVRVSPHTLRHTFATQYILNGGDAFSLQQILGHATLDMVRVYVGLANKDVALQHQKFSPMDRMGLLPSQGRQVVLK